MLDHPNSCSSFPVKERARARDQPYTIEPIWEQFVALLPERKVEHSLDCDRLRIPDMGHSDLSQVRSMPSPTKSAREPGWRGCKGSSFLSPAPAGPT